MSTATETKPPSSTLSPKGMLIGGQWVDSASGARFTVENPAKRKPIAEVPRGNAADVERAVAAATKAYADWRKVVPRERGKAAAQDRRGHPGPRRGAGAHHRARDRQCAAHPGARRGQHDRRHLPLLRRAGERAQGRDLPLGEHVLSYTRREPLGVVGAIIPWNAPVMLAALKIAPALCAGNTMVMKAAEDAPLGVLLMAEICQQFLPPGVLNVLTGYGEDAARRSPTIPRSRKLSFTGSTEVGKIVMRAAAERIVPVSLELGGKSPSIVYPDADEDWAVDGIIAAMRFTRQSQSCTAGSRLFLHEDIFDSFLEQAREEDDGAQDRRSARRGDRHRHHHQQQAVHQGLQVCPGGPEALRRQAGVRRPAAQDRPVERGLLRHPDGVRRPLQRLAAGARGDLRAGAGGDPLERRGRGDPHGQRQPLRPRRLCLDARHRQGPADRARHRIRAGCRSTRAAARRPACPTAATSRAASAASSRSKACSTASPSARA